MQTMSTMATTEEYECTGCLEFNKKLRRAREWNKFYQQKLENKEKFLHIALDYEREKQHNVELQLAYDQRSRESSYIREQMTNLLLEIEPLKEKLAKAEEELKEQMERRDRAENQETGLLFALEQQKHQIKLMREKTDCNLIEILEKKLSTSRSDIRRLKVTIEDKTCEIDELRKYQADRRLHFERINKRALWAMKLARKLIELLPEGILAEMALLDTFARLNSLFATTERTACAQYKEYYKREEQKFKKDLVQISALPSLEEWLDDFDIGSHEEVLTCEGSPQDLLKKNMTKEGRKLEMLLQDDTTAHIKKENGWQLCNPQLPTQGDRRLERLQGIKSEPLQSPKVTANVIQNLSPSSRNTDEVVTYDAKKVNVPLEEDSYVSGSVSKVDLKTSLCSTEEKEKPGSLFDSDSEDPLPRKLSNISENVANSISSAILPRNSSNISEKVANSISSTLLPRKSSIISENVGNSTSSVPVSRQRRASSKPEGGSGNRRKLYLENKGKSCNKPTFSDGPANSRGIIGKKLPKEQTDDDIILAILNDMKPRVKLDCLENSFSLPDPELPGVSCCFNNDVSVFGDFIGKPEDSIQNQLVQIDPQHDLDRMTTEKPKILLSQSSEGFPTIDIANEGNSSFFKDPNLSDLKNPKEDEIFEKISKQKEDENLDKGLSSGVSKEKSAVVTCRKVQNLATGVSSENEDGAKTDELENGNKNPRLLKKQKGVLNESSEAHVLKADHSSKQYGKRDSRTLKGLKSTKNVKQGKINQNNKDGQYKKLGDLVSNESLEVGEDELDCDTVRDVDMFGIISDSDDSEISVSSIWNKQNDDKNECYHSEYSKLCVRDGQNSQRSDSSKESSALEHGKVLLDNDGEKGTLGNNGCHDSGLICLEEAQEGSTVKDMCNGGFNTRNKGKKKNSNICKENAEEICFSGKELVIGDEVKNHTGRNNIDETDFSNNRNIILSDYDECDGKFAEENCHQKESFCKKMTEAVNHTSSQVCSSDVESSGSKKLLRSKQDRSPSITCLESAGNINIKASVSKVDNVHPTGDHKVSYDAAFKNSTERELDSHSPGKCTIDVAYSNCAARPQCPSSDGLSVAEKERKALPVQVTKYKEPDLLNDEKKNVKNIQLHFPEAADSLVVADDAGKSMLSNEEASSCVESQKALECRSESRQQCQKSDISNKLSKIKADYQKVLGFNRSSINKRITSTAKMEGKDQDKVEVKNIIETKNQLSLPMLITSSAINGNMTCSVTKENPQPVESDENTSNKYTDKTDDDIRKDLEDMFGIISDSEDEDVSSKVKKRVSSPLNRVKEKMTKYHLLDGESRMIENESSCKEICNEVALQVNLKSCEDITRNPAILGELLDSEKATGDTSNPESVVHHKLSAGMAECMDDIDTPKKDSCQQNVAEIGVLKNECETQITNLTGNPTVEVVECVRDEDSPVINLCQEKFIERDVIKKESQAQAQSKCLKSPSQGSKEFSKTNSTLGVTTRSKERMRKLSEASYTKQSSDSQEGTDSDSCKKKYEVVTRARSRSSSRIAEKMGIIGTTQETANHDNMVICKLKNGKCKEVDSQEIKSSHSDEEPISGNAGSGADDTAGKEFSRDLTSSQQRNSSRLATVERKRKAHQLDMQERFQVKKTKCLGGSEVQSSQSMTRNSEDSELQNNSHSSSGNSFLPDGGVHQRNLSSVSKEALQIQEQNLVVTDECLQSSISRPSRVSFKWGAKRQQSCSKEIKCASAKEIKFTKCGHLGCIDDLHGSLHHRVFSIENRKRGKYSIGKNLMDALEMDQKPLLLSPSFAYQEKITSLKQSKKEADVHDANIDTNSDTSPYSKEDLKGVEKEGERRGEKESLAYQRQSTSLNQEKDKGLVKTRCRKRDGNKLSVSLDTNNSRFNMKLEDPTSRKKIMREVNLRNRKKSQKMLFGTESSVVEEESSDCENEMASRSKRKKIDRKIVNTRSRAATLGMVLNDDVSSSEESDGGFLEHKKGKFKSKVRNTNQRGLRSQEKGRSGNTPDERMGSRSESEDQDSDSLSDVQKMKRKSSKRRECLIVTSESDDSEDEVNSLKERVNHGTRNVVKDSCKEKLASGKKFKSRLVNKAARLFKKSYYPVSNLPQYQHIKSSRAEKNMEDPKERLTDPLRGDSEGSTGSPKIKSCEVVNQAVCKIVSPQKDASEIASRLSYNYKMKQENKRTTILIDNTPPQILSRQMRKNSEAEFNSLAVNITVPEKARESNSVKKGNKSCALPELDNCDYESSEDSEIASLTPDVNNHEKKENSDELGNEESCSDIEKSLHICEGTSENEEDIKKLSASCNVESQNVQDKLSPIHKAHPGLVSSLAQLGNLTRPVAQPRQSKPVRASSPIHVPASSDFVDKLFSQKSSCGNKTQKKNSLVHPKHERELCDVTNPALTKTDNNITNNCNNLLNLADLSQKHIFPSLQYVDNKEDPSMRDNKGIPNFYRTIDNSAIDNKLSPSPEIDLQADGKATVSHKYVECKNSQEQVVITQSLQISDDSLSKREEVYIRPSKILEGEERRSVDSYFSEMLEEISVSRISSQQWHYFINKLCIYKQTAPQLNSVARVFIKAVLRTDPKEKKDFSRGLTPSLFKLFQAMSVLERRLLLPFSHLKTLILTSMHKLIVTRKSMRPNNLACLASWFTASTLLPNEQGEFHFEWLRSFMIDLFYHHPEGAQEALLSALQTSKRLLINPSQERNASCLEKLILWIALHGDCQGSKRVQTELGEWFSRNGYLLSAPGKNPMVLCRELLAELSGSVDIAYSRNIILSIVVLTRWQKKSWIQKELIPEVGNIASVKAIGINNSKNREAEASELSGNFKILMDYLMEELKKPVLPSLKSDEDS